MCVSYFDRTYVGSTVLSMDAFGIRSFGVFGVANVGALRFVCVDLTDRNASLRRMLRASLVEVLLILDQRRGPKPAVPCGSYGISTYVTDEVRFMRHSRMRSFACVVTSVIRTYSLLLLLFCYYYFYRGSTVLSHHVGRRRMMWLK